MVFLAELEEGTLLRALMNGCLAAAETQLHLDSDLVDDLSIDRSCRFDIGLRLPSLPHRHFILG